MNNKYAQKREKKKKKKMVYSTGFLTFWMGCVKDMQGLLLLSW